MEEEHFIRIVTTWRTITSATITEKLKVLSADLKEWSRKHARINRKNIAEVKVMIEMIRSSTDHQAMLRVEELKLKLNYLLLQNDIYWNQLAKQFWLKEGDLNIKYFHSMATRRKARKRIQTLVDNTGVEFNDPQNLGRIAYDYFEQLFSLEAASYDAVINQIEPKLSVDENNFLLSPLTIEDFREALFQMDPNKSPGPDGYNPAFF